MLNLNVLNPVFDIYITIQKAEDSPRWHLFDKKFTKSSTIKKITVSFSFEYMLKCNTFLWW